MSYLRMLAPLALAAFSQAATAQLPGRTLFDDVARALGGGDRIAAVHSLMVQGTGRNYNLGQNPSPDAPLPMYEVTKYVRAYDFASSRWRQDQTREARFPTGNMAPQRQRFGYDVVAYDITSDTTMRRLGERPTVDRRAEFFYHPIGFLQAALKPGVRLVEERGNDSTRRLRLDADGQTYVMVVDRRSRLPLRIERRIHHNMLGDATVSSEFSDWKVVSNVRLPMKMSQRIDGHWPLAEMELSDARVNVAMNELAIDDVVKTAALQAPPVNVAIDSIAPGVWYVTGGSHHSVAIEMRDHILLIEAPQSEDRTLAVIRKVRELRPSKPIRAAVNTHHHFDHSGGIRAALAEGLVVITHAGNVPFYQGLAKRPFTIAADALAKAPKPAVVEGVAVKRVLTDGARTVELHEITGSTHSETMLVAYLPAEKLLIEADLYSPPAANVTAPPPAPFAKSLVENIDRLELQVERIVPIHGRVIPFADLRAAAGM